MESMSFAIYCRIIAENNHCVFLDSTTVDFFDEGVRDDFVQTLISIFDFEIL